MEIKPCPFCGGKEITVCTTEDLGHYNVEFGFFCVCDARRCGCGASTGWSETEDDAMDDWNRRADDV